MKRQLLPSLALLAGLLCTSALQGADAIFQADSSQNLPAGWRFTGGNWQRKPLVRPQRNKTAVVAVESTRHVAFPGICKSKHGTLLVVYREGYTHASGKPDDGWIMLVRSTDGGKTWGQPELVFDDPTMDDRNAAISSMNDGTLCVIFDKYLKGKHHFAWLMTSTDDGRTWSEPIKVSQTENVHTRSRALDLGNGRWLIPYSESTNSPTASSFFSIYDPKTRTFEEIAATPRGNRPLADETAVERAANGDLVALIRSNWDPEFFQIVSKDNGRTWSEPQTCGIPSQFTPADLVRLQNGWLVASFSFRERRNERLVVSRDNGQTWDIENSVDLFDGTRSVGGDRSYAASVELDAETIGTVLYETQASPTGGRIYFVTTKLCELDAPKESVLYQGDVDTEAAFALWPNACEGAEFSYRFTGRLGSRPNMVGLLLDYTDAKNYTALEYQMGVTRDRRGPANQVQLVRSVDGKLTVSHAKEAASDWFNDGNLHRFAVERQGDQWAFTLDGIAQFSVPLATGKPCGILVRRACVAIDRVQCSPAGK